MVSLSPFEPLALTPAGEVVPAVRGDLAGVRACAGEELAALQGVHPAGARQAGGEYPAAEVGRGRTDFPWRANTSKSQTSVG